MSFNDTLRHPSQFGTSTMTNSNHIESYLPLQEATFFILLSLDPGPKYGYAIMKEVEVYSKGRVILSTSTLYSALNRLLQQKWIERVDDPEPNNTDRVRKNYVLTHLGREVMGAEVARLQGLVLLAKMRLTGERI
jgi:DNA-binding PadR family transcriptional regulator